MDTAGVIDIHIPQEDPVHQTDLKSIKTSHINKSAQRPSISSTSAMNSSEASSSPSFLTVSTNTKSINGDEGSPRNDNAKSQTSQIQPEAQPRQHQESTQVTEIENNESITNPPQFYPSFTSEYDYGGNEDYFYADPFTVSQDQASFMLNPSSYNFSGLQVGITNIW